MTEEISKHPYDPFIPENTAKLVIGSIPPYRFCSGKNKLKDGDIEFYYGSCKNHFWTMLLGQRPKSAEDCKKFLTDKNIGITDIIAECVHENGNSGDKDLKKISQKDIGKLLAKNPSINTLIYTSRFISEQIKKAFKKYGNNYKVRNEDNRGHLIEIDGKQYSVIVLYSPSNSAARALKRIFGDDWKAKRQEFYNSVFLDK
jgi:G:T/U-mismatch repair DNA glycosylase